MEIGSSTNSVARIRSAQKLPIERAEVIWARKETAGLRFVEVSAEARAALDAVVARSAS